jgi:glyoxylate reductase
MARRAIGFDMKIIYHNRRRLPEDEETISPGHRAQVLAIPILSSRLPADKGDQYCKTTEQLLGEADVVSLNLPLNASTKGFFDDKCFSHMKDGAVLVKSVFCLFRPDKRVADVRSKARPGAEWSTNRLFCALSRAERCVP